MSIDVEQRQVVRDWVRPVAAGAAGACLFVALCVASVDLLWLACVLALAASGACIWIALRTDTEPAPVPAPPHAVIVPSRSDLGAVAAANALLEGLAEPALLIDAGSKVLAVNAAARRHLQMQGPGARLSSVLRAPALLDAAHNATEDRVRAAVDYEPLGGVEEHFKVAVAPVSLETGPAALMVFYDQTAMISTEQMRVEFLANASHELRTPLASLTLLIETLGGHAKDDPDAQAQFLALMQTQAERMKRLIDDLLSLSKIELNEHVPPAGGVDLVPLAREIADTLRPIAAERGVAILVRADKPQAMVVGERFELIQVAQNLVDNAIKYSPKGADVEIEIGLAPSREEAIILASRRWGEAAARFSLLSAPPAGERRYAYLRVTDSGPGIARRHLPRLSERFFRVEREESADHSGTGLGLAIVKHIVNRHRGGFTVESEVGRGSAFAVYIEQPDE